LGLENIYTELIAEESRNPENRHHLASPTVTLKGRNPSCGDEITLELEVENGVVRTRHSRAWAVPYPRHPRQ
jgi:nitrogen fixation NifU-like protein